MMPSMCRLKWRPTTLLQPRSIWRCHHWYFGCEQRYLGVGLGSKPIGNMDVFCFADPSWPLEGDESAMPVGLKAPRRLLEGVHKGVEDGGNMSGIPTVNGAIFFDQDYAGKPLVFVGTVG